MTENHFQLPDVLDPTGFRNSTQPTIWTAVTAEVPVFLKALNQIDLSKWPYEFFCGQDTRALNVYSVMLITNGKFERLDERLAARHRYSGATK